MTAPNFTAQSADAATVQRDKTASEYLGKLLEQHRLGASENDIRSAFRDFLIRTGIADDESEIVTEATPAAGSLNKVDLYLRNTYVEFKRSIIRGGVIDSEVPFAFVAWPIVYCLHGRKQAIPAGPEFAGRAVRPG